MMKYIMVYHDWLSIMEPLSDSERGRLITAALIYAETGTAIDLPGPEKYVFPTIKLQIDRDSESYAAKVQRRSECGKQGGRPKNQEAKAIHEKQKKQKLFTESKKSQDKNKDKDKDKDKDNTPIGVKTNSASRFAPPTVEEVTEYCNERKNNVCPQTFVDFYASKGWKVGANPMKDWRASVRTWEKRDSSVQAILPPPSRAAPPGQKPHYNPFIEMAKEGKA